jgi:hypothetical protein
MRSLSPHVRRQKFQFSPSPTPRLSGVPPTPRAARGLTGRMYGSHTSSSVRLHEPGRATHEEVPPRTRECGHTRMAAMAADQRAAETATTSPNTDQRPAVGQTPETAAAAHEKQSNDQAGAARFATVPPGGERDEPAVRAGGTGRAGFSPRRPPLRPADTNSPGVRAGGSPRDESPRCHSGKRPRAEPPLDDDEPDIAGGGDSVRSTCSHDARFLCSSPSRRKPPTAPHSAPRCVGAAPLAPAHSSVPSSFPTLTPALVLPAPPSPCRSVLTGNAPRSGIFLVGS